MSAGSSGCSAEIRATSRSASVVGNCFDVLALWRERADNVSGGTVP